LTGRLLPTARLTLTLLCFDVQVMIRRLEQQKEADLR